MIVIIFLWLGTVGMLVPFSSNEDHDFFQHLEMHMRGENPPLCGRDHLSYRYRDGEKGRKERKMND